MSKNVKRLLFFSLCYVLFGVYIFIDVNAVASNNFLNILGIVYTAIKSTTQSVPYELFDVLNTIGYFVRTFINACLSIGTLYYLIKVSIDVFKKD